MIPFAGTREVVSSQEAANVTFTSTHGVLLSHPASLSNHPFHAARSNVLQLDPLEILALAAKSTWLSKASQVTSELKWVRNGGGGGKLKGLKEATSMNLGMVEKNKRPNAFLERLGRWLSCTEC